MLDKTLSRAVEQAAAFFNRICGPAADEFGLLLRDEVHLYRMKNLVRLAEKAERFLEKKRLTGSVQAHPRLVAAIVADGSWIEDD